MRRVVRLLVMLIYAGLGAVGLFLTEQVFWQEWRWLGLVVGNLLFPVAAIGAALYDGFANGDWTLALIDASGFLFIAVFALTKRSSD